MFFCEPCRKAREWPASMCRSRGGCEICGVQAVCYDVPFGALPLPAGVKPLPPRDDSADRYFLMDAEVTKAQYVAAERNAGFRNTHGKSDEPATASFSAGSGVRGHIEYGGAS